LKKPRSDDVNTGSTYHHSNVEQHKQSQFQPYGNQSMLEMSQKKKHCDQVHDSAFLKTPEQTIKMNTKQCNSILRNDSPDNREVIANGNISSDDQEKQVKRSDGTFYISNITNNIIMDKKTNNE